MKFAKTKEDKKIMNIRKLDVESKFFYQWWRLRISVKHLIHVITRKFKEGLKLWQKQEK
jgi:hypothetical protein